MTTETSSAERPLRICHVITRMIVGGAQENTLLSCRGLLEKGHEVTLITGPSEGPEGELLQRSKIPNLQLVEIPSLCRELRPLTDLKAYFTLKRYFKRRKFDVVHTHSSKAGILGRLAARHAGVPLVVHTVHGQAFHPYEKAWRNRLFIAAERLAAKACDHIFSVAQAMIDQCVAAGVAPASRYSVVYSGMDMNAFLNAKADPELRAKLGIPEHAPVIGKIARLFELKGHEYVIQAAPEIVKEFPNVRFLFVGNGNLREELEAEIARRGLQQNFVFTGLVSPDEVPRYTALMDILVHLSLREGLPRTVVQALAAGVPAIGFALDGTPEVIKTGETGILCQAENIEEVKQAILKLLRNPQQAREMGQNGRRFVQERFDWPRMAGILEREYRRLLLANSC
jgi:glycosyltransferase involved in cell wall biosynthesis